jgi:hypothetical protein
MPDLGDGVHQPLIPLATVLEALADAMLPLGDIFLMLIRHLQRAKEHHGSFVVLALEVRGDPSSRGLGGHDLSL